MSPLKSIHKQRLFKNKETLWDIEKNRWIQTPQRILMDPCIKQAPVLSKRFWIIPWPLAYNRLELHCVRKIINFRYTFGWKWRVFVTIWDCRTHVRMTSMTSSVEQTDLDFKISVALVSRLKSDGRAYTNALQGWPSILLHSNQQVGHCGQGCRSFSEYCCQWCSQQQCPVLKSNGCLYTWKNTNHVAIKEIRVYGQS